MRGFSYQDDETWVQRTFRWITRNVFRRSDRPITDNAAKVAAKFVRDTYGQRIESATSGTPFSAPLLAAMICQETAYFWLEFVRDLPPEQLNARCVLDASGDILHNRHVFPRNTAEFRQRFGDEFSNVLIAEANETRRLRGLGPAQYVYAGYGIFQYDLQEVLNDEAFFRQKRWHDFDECLARVMKELKAKFAITHDLWEAVRAYNGAGAAAQQYKRNVQHYFPICQREWNAAALSS